MSELRKIELPQFAHFGHIIETLYRNDIYELKDNKINIVLPEECHFTPEGLAFLCAWGMQAKDRGCTIQFSGDTDIQNYLSRMDLFEHLDFSFEEKFNRHNELGRFIPLRLISDYTDVVPATNDICELVIHQFENAHEFLPALEWAVNEIIDNIYNHAGISSPAAICGQYYPMNKRLEIAIIDTGQGVKANMSRAFGLNTDRTALEKALARGVTSSGEEFRGNGLAGTREIVLNNGGSFRFWSGESQYHISNGVEQGYHEIPFMQGTGALIKLKTEKPVDLTDTFIGEKDWSYLNFLCQEIESVGALKISEETDNTVTREAGRRLRLKIESILPEMNGLLVLDFSDISMTTSSFVDELFGKLYHKYGSYNNIKLKVVNLNSILLSMVNATIAGRAEVNVKIANKSILEGRY